MKKLLLIGTTLVVALLPVLAMAAGGGDGHEKPHADLPGLARHGINLLLLLGILWWALRGPLGDFLNFRRAEVKDQLDASATAKAEAEKNYAELSTRLENFEAELEELRARVRTDSENERSTLMANAEHAAAGIEEAAKRTVTEELRRARAELKAEAVELSVQIAEELLTKNITDDDQARLTGDYLSRVEETARS
ncbi:MAG: hypothetical protein KDA24_07885 [Deltaproteobacteria bacterium]|nr:hypothetical protein [Deltaproteobacteria bacterium]